MKCGPGRGVVCIMWSKAGPEPPWGGTGWGRGQRGWSGQRDAGLELCGRRWREPGQRRTERGSPWPMAAPCSCLRLLPVCVLGRRAACCVLRAYLGTHAAARRPRRPPAQCACRSLCPCSATCPTSCCLLLAWSLRRVKTTAAGTATEPPPQPPPSAGSDARDHAPSAWIAWPAPTAACASSLCTTGPRLRPPLPWPWS